MALASFVLVLRTLPRDAVSFFIFRSFRLVVLSLLFSSLLVVLAQLAALFDGRLDSWRRRTSGSTRTSSAAIVLELGDLFGVGVLQTDLASVYRVHPASPAHGVVSGVKVLSLVDFLGEHVLLGRQFAVELENPLLFGRQRRHVDLVCTVGVQRRHVECCGSSLVLFLMESVVWSWVDWFEL